MTKPDDTRWTPKEDQEIADMAKALFDKFVDIVRRDVPQTPAGYNAVLHAASDLIATTVVQVSANPREMIAVIASDLTRAVNERLGDRETEH